MSDSPTPDVSLREKAEAICARAECRRPKAEHVEVRGRFYCFDFVLATSAEHAVAEFVGPAAEDKWFVWKEDLDRANATITRLIAERDEALSRVERAEAELWEIDLTIGNPLALDRNWTRTQKIAHMLRTLASVNAPATPEVPHV